MDQEHSPRRRLYQGQGISGHKTVFISDSRLSSLLNKDKSILLEEYITISVYYRKSILREEYIYEKRRKEYIIV